MPRTGAWMQFVNGLSLACVKMILINAYDIYDPIK